MKERGKITPQKEAENLLDRIFAEVKKPKNLIGGGLFILGASQIRENFLISIASFIKSFKKTVQFIGG